MSSTRPEKKKKVVKIKKVVKKEKKSPSTDKTKNVTSPAVAKSKQNGSDRKPSIEDAISRFSAMIAEQTEMINQLKLENQKLKNEMEELRTKPPETKIVYISKAGGNDTTENGRQRAMSRKQLSGPPQKELPNNGVVTNISQADAKNALSGLFGGAKQKPANDDAVVTDISQKDAKNALSSLLGSKQQSPPQSSAVGNGGGGTNLSIATPSRLLKYEKLSKVMPTHVLENKMKMDGVTRMLIAQLTKQWLPATVPDGYQLVEKQLSSPPPIPSEFRHLIANKNSENEDGDGDDEDESQARLKALGLKPKKQIKPSRQMKRFHWKKIEAEHIPPTIWFKLDGDAAMPYNKTEFELKFSFKPPRTATTNKKVVSKKDRSDQVYTFIDPKRSQNIQIALSKFKHHTHSELKAAVIGMDETVFDLDLLLQFAEIAPTEDEQHETELHANKEDVDPMTNFGRAEKFFYALIDIVDLALRLKLWIFMMNFKEVVSDKQAQIFQLDAACQRLSKCESFQHILKMVLCWGNHMNASSAHNGNAYGFEIDGLALLPGLKTMDGQMNMMMYLYKTLYEKFPDDLSVFEDLKPIKVCATFDTDMMDKTVLEMKEQFERLQQTVTIFKDDYQDILEWDDRFVVYATKFIKDHKTRLNKLVMLHQRIKHKCDTIAQLYKWNLNEHRIEALFTVCARFLSDFYKARDDLHKLELERERRQKKKKKNLKRETGAKAANEKYKEKVQFGHKVQKHKRSILDDARARKRKNTIMLDKIGDKLKKALEEKSKLIETVNYKRKLPEQFQKNKVKRKISSIYGESVQKVKTVPKGRMRLPSIAAQLSALSQSGNDDDEKSEQKESRHLSPQKTPAAAAAAPKKVRRAPVQKRKRTKGWFKKGKEPKPPPRPTSMAYNTRAGYEQGYKSAFNRDRGISNHKSGNDNAGRYRSDTPAHPTPLSALSDHDIAVGQNRANQIHQQFANTDGPQYKRAQSMKVSSKKKSLLNRAAYSPPNSGIVRLDKFGLNNNETGDSKKASDLNLPQNMLGGGGDTQRVTILIESPTGSPRQSSKKTDEEFLFSEEHSWD